MAEHVHTTASTTRRPLAAAILAALGAAFILPDTSAAITIGQMDPACDLDAELIALCVQFEALEHEFCATDFEAEPGTAEAVHAAAEQRRITDAQTAIVKRLQAVPVKTLDGAKALARALAFYDAELFPTAVASESTKDMMLGALVFGLTGWPAEARTV